MLISAGMLFIADTAGAQGSACRAADSVSAKLIEDIRQFSTATTGDNAKTRIALKLPLTSDVALVNSPTICKKAKDTFAAEFASQGSGLSGTVYVISVGTVYAVVDPGYRYNNVSRDYLWPFVYFVDSRFKKLSILAA